MKKTMNINLLISFIILSISYLNCMNSTFITNKFGETQTAEEAAIDLSSEFISTTRLEKLSAYDKNNLEILKNFLIKNPFEPEVLKNCIQATNKPVIYTNARPEDLLNTTYYSLLVVNPNNSKIFNNFCQPTYNFCTTTGSWLESNCTIFDANCKKVIITPYGTYTNFTRIKLFACIGTNICACTRMKKSDFVISMPMHKIKTASFYESASNYAEHDLYNYTIITDIKNKTYVFETTRSSTNLLFELESFETVYFNEYRRYIFCITNDGKVKVIDFDLVAIIDRMLKTIFS